MSTKCNFDCCDFGFFKATINPDERFVLWLSGRLFLFSFSDSAFSRIGPCQGVVLSHRPSRMTHGYCFSIYWPLDIFLVFFFFILSKNLFPFWGVCSFHCYSGGMYNFRQVRSGTLTISKSTKYMFLWASNHFNHSLTVWISHGFLNL